MQENLSTKGGTIAVNDFYWKGNSALGAGGVVLPKGTPITVITATITAVLTGSTTYTSSSTDISGFNSMLLETTLSGSKVTTTIDGSMTSGGTMNAIFNKETSAQMTTGAITSSRTLLFSGLTDYLGLTATFSAGITAGTSVSVVVLPLNL